MEEDEEENTSIVQWEEGGEDSEGESSVGYPGH